MASGFSSRCCLAHLLRRASPSIGHPTVTRLSPTLAKHHRNIQSRLFSADGDVVTHTEAAVRHGASGTGAKVGTGLKDASPRLELCGDIEGEVSLLIRLEDRSASVIICSRFCCSTWVLRVYSM